MAGDVYGEGPDARLASTLPRGLQEPNGGGGGGNQAETRRGGEPEAGEIAGMAGKVRYPRPRASLFEALRGETDSY